MKLAILLLAITYPAVTQNYERAAQTTQDKDVAHLTLAKHGDHDALQHFACRALTSNMFDLEKLMTDFDQIGGDFTVQVYRRLLDSDQRFRPEIDRIRKERGQDAVPKLPSISVLFHLPKILPGAHISAPEQLEYEVNPNQDLGFRAKWRNWIDSHSSELQKLKPTADGVDFGPQACSNFAR